MTLWNCNEPTSKCDQKCRVNQSIENSDIKTEIWKEIVSSTKPKIKMNDNEEAQIIALELYINLYQLMKYVLWLMRTNIRIENQKKQFMFNPQLHNQSNLDDDSRENLNLHKDDKLSLSSNIWESNNTPFLKIGSIPNKSWIAQSGNLQKEDANLVKIKYMENVPYSEDEIRDQCCIKFNSSFLNKNWIKSYSWDLDKDSKSTDSGIINLKILITTHLFLNLYIQTNLIIIKLEKYLLINSICRK